MSVVISNELFREKSIFWAWQYYDTGQESNFERLLLQTLDCCPAHSDIFNYEGNLQEKEKAFLTVFTAYWNKPENTNSRAVKKKAFIYQHTQLAWAYYHREDVQNFRRCIRKVVHYSLPKIPVRLLLALVKSFLGKSLAEKIHRVRNRVLPR